MGNYIKKIIKHIRLKRKIRITCMNNGHFLSFDEKEIIIYVGGTIEECYSRRKNKAIINYRHI